MNELINNQAKLFAELECRKTNTVKKETQFQMKRGKDHQFSFGKQKKLNKRRKSKRQVSLVISVGVTELIWSLTSLLKDMASGMIWPLASLLQIDTIFFGKHTFAIRTLTITKHQLKKQNWLFFELSERTHRRN